MTGLGLGFKKENVVRGVDLQVFGKIVDIYWWVRKTGPRSTFSGTLMLT
jgi:hypothetical protein